MDKIRQATKIVTGKLSESEKMQLIHLLSKLEDFHQEIFQKQIPSADLIDKVLCEHVHLR